MCVPKSRVCPLVVAKLTRAWFSLLFESTHMLSKQALQVILSLTGADDFEARSWATLAFLCYTSQQDATCTTCKCLSPFCPRCNSTCREFAKTYCVVCSLKSIKKRIHRCSKLKKKVGCRGKKKSFIFCF